MKLMHKKFQLISIAIKIKFVILARIATGRQ